jgi:hypothetical protein
MVEDVGDQEQGRKKEGGEIQHFVHGYFLAANEEERRDEQQTARGIHQGIETGKGIHKGGHIIRRGDYLLIEHDYGGKHHDGERHDDSEYELFVFHGCLFNIFFSGICQEHFDAVH